MSSLRAVPSIKQGAAVYDEHYCKYYLPSATSSVPRELLRECGAATTILYTFDTLSMSSITNNLVKNFWPQRRGAVRKELVHSFVGIVSIRTPLLLGKWGWD